MIAWIRDRRGLLGATALALALCIAGQLVGQASQPTGALGVWYEVSPQGSRAGGICISGEAVERRFHLCLARWRGKERSAQPSQPSRASEERATPCTQVPTCLNASGNSSVYAVYSRASHVVQCMHHLF